MLHSANHSCSIPNWHDKNDVNIIILFVDILNTHSCCGLLTLNCSFFICSLSSEVHGKERACYHSYNTTNKKS
jgi:hypothetical protein